MPRTGGVYSPPAGTKGVSNTTIQSVPYNSFVDDLTADANAARPITAGGTGATSASAARTALGLEIGTNVQAYDAGLQSIAGLTTSANQMLYTTATDVYATTALTPFARTILDDANAADVRATIGAQAALGYTPVNKAGDIMTGNLTTPDLILPNGGHVYFTTSAVARGVIYHDVAGFITLNLYNAAGTFIRSLRIHENGEGYWDGSMFQIGLNSGTAEYRLNAGVNHDFRILGDSGDQFFIQKSTNEWAGASNLLSWNASAEAAFPSNVSGSTFIASASGIGQNFKVGDDVWIGDINISNSMSIRGVSDPTSGFIYFGNTAHRFGVSGAANVRLYWGNDFFIQTDGNIYLPVFSDYLGNILVSKAGFSVSTNTNETNFPIGQVLMVNTPTSPPARRDVRTLYLDGGVAGGYSTSSGSSQLAGTWRQIGNISATYSEFQRVA